MHLTLFWLVPHSRARHTDRNGADVVCPRCGHGRARHSHRGMCSVELQLIYDPDGVPCGCGAEFHR